MAKHVALTTVTLGWLLACGDGSVSNVSPPTSASASNAPPGVVLDAPPVLRDCNDRPGDGDETRLGTDAHCGGCNRACKDGERCVADACLSTADIAMTDTHTCVLRGGRVWCMGANEAGELGDGTAQMRSRPTRVVGFDDAIQLATRPRETCVLRRSGAVSCWGEAFGTGRPGRLRFVPTDVPELHGATDLALAENVLCALVPERGIVCLPPAKAGKAIAVAGPPPGPPIEDAVDIAAIKDQLCAVRREGDVVCWNLAPFEDVPASERRQIIAGATGTLAVIGRERTMCALRAGNLAACWGGGIVTAQGGLRDAMVGGVHDFGAVGGVSDVAFLGWPDDADCATRVDGTTICWKPPFIDIVDAAKPRAVKPTTIAVPPALRLESTKSREAHCVLTREHEVHCWGEVTLGRLGVGHPPEQLTPLPIEAVTGVREVVASDQRACARTGRGLQCWGAGELPREVKIDGLERVLSGMCASVKRELVCYAGLLEDPLPKSGLRDVVALAPGAQGSHLLSYSALHKDGTVSRVDWSREKGPWSLVQVGRIKGLDGIEELLAVDRHTCVRSGDKGIRCWESLGTPPPGSDGTISLTITSTQMPEAYETVRITRVLDGGKTEGCGLLEGRLRCWNTDGATKQVLDRVTRFDISPHGLVCATRVGALFCWAGAADSYTGHGTIASPRTPTEVRGLQGILGFAFAQESFNERDAVFTWNKAGMLMAWGHNGRSENDGRTGVLGWVEPSRIAEPTKVSLAD